MKQLKDEKSRVRTAYLFLVPTRRGGMQIWPRCGISAPQRGASGFPRSAWEPGVRYSTSVYRPLFSGGIHAVDHPLVGEQFDGLIQTGFDRLSPNGVLKAPGAISRLNARHAGFTLLEVLIALAVLAVLMMGLLKISAANAQNLWYLENKTLAATIAANHAAEMRLQDQQQESADGWDEMAGRRWHWQADRLAMSPMAGVQRYRIDVTLQDDPSPYASLIIDLAEKS